MVFLRAATILGSLGLFMGACGLQKMLPEGPVLSTWEWSETYARPLASTARYTGPARVPFPVIPLQIWGIAYELDVVVVSQNPKYDMHEFASVRTEEGLVWIAKDAAGGTLEQSIVTNLKQPYEWFPEIPVRRSSGPLRVTGTPSADWIDMSFEYTSLAGDDIRASYLGKPPKTAMRKRNGSTMGHSRDSLLAVLDLSHRNFGRKASITYNDTPEKMKRLLGLVPFQMSLQQVQGGVAVTSLRQESPMLENGDPGVSNQDFVTYYSLPEDHTVSREWDVLYRANAVRAVQHSPHRTLEYEWRVSEEAYELTRATVRQPGRESAVVTVRFQPALPDVRRPFEGVVESRFGIAVNGQEGHAIGTAQAYWKDGSVQVRLLPTSPWWVADRPLESTLTYSDGGVQLETVRLEVPSP